MDHTRSADKRVPLTRDSIAEAALLLLNEIGLDKLTTRRLGEYLNVEGPALYRHFPSKSALFDHMAAAILFPVLRAPRSGEPWDEWLRMIATKSCDAVMKYRDGAKLVAASLPIEPLDLLSKPMREAGFSPEDALYASKLLSRFMVGWQLLEDSERQRADRPEENYDHARALSFAIDSIINGLRLRLAKTMALRIDDNNLA